MGAGRIVMKAKIPILISRNIVVFPQVTESIEVGREFSISAIHEANQNYQNKIIIVCQKDSLVENPTNQDCYKMGTLCHIEQTKIHDENNILLVINGLERVLLTDMQLIQNNDKKEFWISAYSTVREKNATITKNKDILASLIAKIQYFFGKDSLEMKTLEGLMDKYPEKVSHIVDHCAAFWPLRLEQNVSIKQKWLEAVDVNKRIKLILEGDYLTDEEKSRLENEITKKLNLRLAKQQNEFYLRERIKIIKEELGDYAIKDEEINKIRKRLQDEPFPPNIKEKLTSELAKLEIAHGSSNEYLMSKNYIDWMISLPWWQTSHDNNDLLQVKDVLNQGHYGLEKIKERILEFLVVQKRRKTKNGSIICFVGPPGVGKTSLAISIAKALNKKFVKISLGGVSDESEIRGHRKTYIGSMPGRIIRGLKNAKTKNPIFLLDEIDKLKSDWKGDPAAALLEVLDPSQNQHFSDNYIEEEFDLSQVMFIATANYEDYIPHALHDRLEIIHLTSYTECEKLEIAKSHLVDEVLEENGLDHADLVFTDEAINYIITRYTREAGVRNLKRLLSTIARKFVLQLEINQKQKEVIKIPEVVRYLKKEIFDYNYKDKVEIPGIVNGMAYTEYGGDLLPIEITYYPGKGNIYITGNLKQTMNESVNVALGYVKSRAKEFGITTINFSEIDINVHVPSGGIPKDGPSAGVAITTALISALRQQSVATTISMTGEITLRGKVLIIGGVKEKVISAVRGGVTKIFMPKDDERYLEDIPADILKKVEIILVAHYQEIFDHIFLNQIDSKMIHSSSKSKSKRVKN